MSKTDSPLSFIQGKMKGTKLGTLLYVQGEAFLWWMVMYLPGLPGMFFRNMVAKLLFKKKSGFTWIQHNVTFVHSNRIRVGSNMGINSGTYINGVGGIEFGNFVLLGSNVTISSGRHPIEGTEPPIYSRPSEPLPIKIEDDVWIAAGAVILPGITLAKGTVVGANSVVTKSTEPYSVVAGVPAKLIKKRTPSL